VYGFWIGSHQDYDRFIQRQEKWVETSDRSNYRGSQQPALKQKTGLLEILAQHVNNDVRHLAMLILEVARVKPHKRRRWEFLAHNHFGLYVRLKELWGDDAPDEVPDFPDLADSDVPF